MQMLILRLKWKSFFLSLDTKNSITGTILFYTYLNVRFETEIKKTHCLVGEIDPSPQSEQWNTYSNTYDSKPCSESLCLAIR